MKHKILTILAATGLTIIGLQAQTLHRYYDKTGKCGYMDPVSRKTKIIPTFEAGSDFKDRLAIVVKNGLMGFINETGTEIIPCQYNEVSEFNYGLARVTKNKKSGFINKERKMIIALQYDEAGDFCDGLSRVAQNGKHGFINADGKLIVPLQYHKVRDFAQQIAPAINGVLSTQAAH